LPGVKKSSNLSNLQIVKKWGSQLSPFLDVEQKTIERLRGTYTSQEDAQWLFSYILNTDIDGTGETPILHYLLDLSVLESEGNGLLKLSKVSKEQSSHEVKNRQLEALNDLSKTENGFHH